METLFKPRTLIRDSYYTEVDKCCPGLAFIKSITGDVAEGKRIKVALGGMKFTPIVLDYKPAKEFRGLGHLLFKGLFDGAHRFHLEVLADGTTFFRHSEKFTGMLVPVFKKKMLEETKANFEAFNRGLKIEAEKK